MINVIIVAAGRGQRFKDAGYTESKPFIQVRGKTILEHCTSSIPFILHGFGKQLPDINLWFALREEDRKYESYIKSVYGTVNIVWESGPILGNLHTATKVIEQILLKTPNDGPLHIYDSDNKFFCSALADISPQSRYPINAVFGMHHSTPEDYLWSNAKIIPSPWDGAAIVEEVREKDPSFSAHPRLIGIFVFSSIVNFMERATNIINCGIPMNNGEFYISQAIVLKSKFFEVDYFIPLGTPEAVGIYENSI